MYTLIQVVVFPHNEAFINNMILIPTEGWRRFSEPCKSVHTDHLGESTGFGKNMCVNNVSHLSFRMLDVNKRPCDIRTFLYILHFAAKKRKNTWNFFNVYMF